MRKMVGRKCLALCVGLLCTAVFASMEDRVLRFSTPGPDCYADGTLVADGECYALVWSPKGATFAGKCRDSLFQIPADEYAELEGGEWAVCLVDTRMANGVPAGVANNAPLRVNRWGAVRNEVKISTASTLVQRPAGVLCSRQRRQARQACAQARSRRCPIPSSRRRSRGLTCWTAARSGLRWRTPCRSSPTP